MRNARSVGAKKKRLGAALNGTSVMNRPTGSSPCSPSSDKHLVLGTPIEGDVPEGFEVAVVGLGCFWGEEQTFWQLPGLVTSVGYAGG